MFKIILVRSSLKIDHLDGLYLISNTFQEYLLNVFEDFSSTQYLVAVRRAKVLLIYESSEPAPLEGYGFPMDG
jgi:hypothetical protein